MPIQTGDTLPDATLLELTADGPGPVDLGALTKGRKIAMFGLPGAYTGTCTTAHVPSFIRTKDELKEKGIEDIICLAVNDPFVMGAGGRSTGGSDAGIRFLGDADGALTKAMGLDFSAPPAGFYGRSQRYAMVVEDGKVTVLNIEDSPGTAEKSSGEALLAAL